MFHLEQTEFDFSGSGTPVYHRRLRDIMTAAKVIRFQNKLLSPVSFGYVYRLAKAPVFLFPDSSLSGAEWRHILLTGHIAS